jgi:hypothetical protein
MKVCVAVACGFLALALVAPSGLAAGKGGETQVVCLTAKTLQKERRVKPRRCVFHRRHAPKAEAFLVRTTHDHWRVWKKQRAKGRGRSQPSMGPSTKVKIKLFDPVHRCGHRVFSRAHFFFPKFNSGSTMKIDVCA